MDNTRIPRIFDQSIAIEINDDQAIIKGDLFIPLHANAIVIFAHGSGSSRFSERNRFVASELNKQKLGTLLIDLLTAAEETIDFETAQLRFDVGLLSRRLMLATHYLKQQLTLKRFNIGYFGASTGAAAAIAAAAQLPGIIKAVVSRGGRLDLASNYLARIKAPSLFIVGALDEVVLALNEQAMLSMTTEKQLAIIPGATHLFSESGALAEVAKLAADWFGCYLN